MHPDTIAEEMGPGRLQNHGDPTTWKYLGKKTVPAIEPGRLPGTKKVYEVFLDESGKQIEVHYWIHPDGTIVQFPGTTSRRGLSK